VRFFEWRGCIPGADYADETIDRVARKVADGLNAPPRDPYLYFHGVALNVIRERWHKQSHDPVPLPADLAVHPFKPDEKEYESRLDGLQECLERLPPASRELLTIYHLGESGWRIGQRKNLSERLGVPAAALRLRVYRIRRQLERCLRRKA
jgi:DNA-directed RNA polymerase specialized sigma24 family protein